VRGWVLLVAAVLAAGACTSTGTPDESIQDTPRAHKMPPPPPVEPAEAPDFYMGAAVHLGDPGRPSDGKTIGEIALTEMGVQSLREEVAWSTPAESTKKFDIIGKHGGKMLLVLGYGNPHFMEGGGFPNTAAERGAFLEYANQTIKKIGPQNLAGIEVWNEWNVYMGWFDPFPKRSWGAPCPDDPSDSAGCPVMYAKLVETLLYPEREGLDIPSLRETAPGVPVLTNSISARDEDWTKASMGYLRDNAVQVDGALIHPYVSHPNGCPSTNTSAPAGPMISVKCIVTVSNEIAAVYGQQLPMWATEVGWSRGGDRSVTPDVQARYVVELYVRARATGVVRGVWWYDLQDDLVDDESVRAFGLVGRHPEDERFPGELHPSGHAYVALAAFWKGCSDMDGSWDGRTFSISCEDETRQIILSATKAELRQASADGATLVDLLGQLPDVGPGEDTSSLAGHHVGVIP